MTLYNFASLLRLHAVFTKPEGKYLYHINAAFAAHIAREFLLGFVPAAKVESLITKFLLPVRPGQQKPRNMRVKRPVSFQYRIIWGRFTFVFRGENSALLFCPLF